MHTHILPINMVGGREMHYFRQLVCSRAPACLPAIAVLSLALPGGDGRDAKVNVFLSFMAGMMDGD